MELQHNKELIVLSRNHSWDLVAKYACAADNLEYVLYCAWKAVFVAVYVLSIARHRKCDTTLCLSEMALEPTSVTIIIMLTILIFLECIMAYVTYVCLIELIVDNAFLFAMLHAFSKRFEYHQTLMMFFGMFRYHILSHHVFHPNDNKEICVLQVQEHARMTSFLFYVFGEQSFCVLCQV